MSNKCFQVTPVVQYQSWNLPVISTGRATHLLLLHHSNLGHPTITPENPMQPMKPGQSSTPHPPTSTERGWSRLWGRLGHLVWCSLWASHTVCQGAGADSHCPQVFLPLPVFSSKAGGVMEQESIRLLEVGRVQGQHGPRHHVQEKDQKVQEGT